MAGYDPRDDEARRPRVGGDDGPSGGGPMDAARRGCTLITGMKKLAVVLVVLIGGSIPYLVAQQPIEVPSLIPPAPVALVATDHPPLPKEVAQYWFVPAATTASAASKDSVREPRAWCEGRHRRRIRHRSRPGEPSRACGDAPRRLREVRPGNRRCRVCRALPTPMPC